MLARQQSNKWHKFIKVEGNAISFLSERILLNMFVMNLMHKLAKLVANYE